MSDQMRTIQLSESAPSQISAGRSGMAYTVGSELHTWKEEDGWYWCISGVGPGGNYSETDDVGPFDSREAAEEDGREHHIVTQNMPNDYWPEV